MRQIITTITNPNNNDLPRWIIATTNIFERLPYFRHWILTIILGVMYYYFPHFTNEERLWLRSYKIYPLFQAKDPLLWFAECLLPTVVRCWTLWLTPALKVPHFHHRLLVLMPSPPFCRYLSASSFSVDYNINKQQILNICVDRFLF